MSERAVNTYPETPPAPGNIDPVTPKAMETDSDAHFYCGAGASMINILITFPINKIMFRQQLFGFRANKAMKQIIHEGVINLYRGLPAPLIQKSISVSLMFGLYHHYNQYLTQRWKLKSNTATVFASIIAGSCEAIFTPFERIQVLLLTPKHHDTFKSTYHAFGSLHKEHGFKEYYRGLSTILIRNGLSNAIFFGLRKPIKEALPATEENTFQNTANDFISGAVIGAMCSTLFYPLNVIKSRLQADVGGRFKSIPETFTVIYNERGRKLRKIFRGCQINVVRSYISWGIINASFEILMELFQKPR